MLIYLDSVIVIHAVEGPIEFQARAWARLAPSRRAVHLAISDLTRLGCRIRPLRLGDNALLDDFDRFFLEIAGNRVPPTASAYDRAAEIRAAYNLKLADALHLAATVESGCDASLTNYPRPARIPGIALELLE